MFYIPSISRASGGIFQYSLATLKILSKLDHTYFIFSYTPLDNEFIDLVSNKNNLIEIPTRETNDNPFLYKLRRTIQELRNLLHKGKINWLTFKPKFAINRAVEKYAIDCIHSPYDQLPHYVSVPMISTVHDIQELHFPQYFSPSERIDRAINKNFLVKESKKIICSYRHIKNDLENMFPESVGKVKVCLLDMQNLWFNKFSKNEVRATSEDGIEENFLLYPAATWEHKNHISLIEAFLKMCDKIKDPITLVCTGKKTSFYYEKIEPIIKEKALRVKFLGIVDEIKLYSLYQSCRAVVIPTKYEAGSFPLMECMIMGIPVVCSNVTSLPETIGDNQFCFNPDDIEEMKIKMIQIVEDEKFRKKNIRNSSQMSQYFTQSKASEIFDSIYSQCK